MNRLASCACVAALLIAFCARASAQDATADPPAHISVVDGTASLERDGRPEPAPTSMPLLAGDRLRTENGRVEVMFADGATLHLDTSSTVDFQSDDVIRLLDGRVRLTIPGPQRAVSYRIDAPGGWIQIQEPGEYRVAVTRADRASRGDRGDEVELVVLRGSADLLNEDGQTTLRAGERAFARAGAAPSYAYVYNSAAWDAFDRWSDGRRAERAGVSTQYLPETVRSYSSTFDRYGSWQYDTSYGYVWYPTVRVGWRPYFYGRWASFPSFGWTWIGTDAWAWPTHHYGRWGFSAGAWFWIPGRTWGPAWVSWGYAPGYVSWCPLGWDNRPVLQFARAGYYGRYDPWNAWTVVPHQRFGFGYVNATFIGGSRIDVRTRNAFVVRQGAPDVRGSAVPRSAAPIYAAGTRRGSAAGYAGNNGRVVGQGSGDSRARASVGGAPGASRPNAADDAAAVFRSRRSSSASGGAGYPAPARAPRESADVIDRMGASRERGTASRPADSADVPVHRGAVPRQPGQSPDSRQSNGAAGSRPSDGGAGSRQPDSAQPRRTDDSRRLDVPGYRRAPAAPQTAPGSAAPAQRTWSVPERQSPSRRYEDNGRIERGPAVDRGGRVAPERQIPEGRVYDGYRGVPRQAPGMSQPPAYRSYGGVIEHRGTPPPAAAPAREPGPPPSAGPSRGEARSREEAPSRNAAPSRGEAPSRGQASERARPSGQGQSDRGGAVRRRGGG
jgi:hypothetical protein